MLHPQQLSQLHQLGQRAHGLVPHLQRLLCFAEAGGGQFWLLFDSQAAARGEQSGSQLWGNPTAQLQQEGAGVLFTEELGDHRIV